MNSSVKQHATADEADAFKSGLVSIQLEERNPRLVPPRCFSQSIKRPNRRTSVKSSKSFGPNKNQNLFGDRFLAMSECLAKANSQFMIDLPRRRSSKSVSNFSNNSSKDDGSEKVCDMDSATFGAFKSAKAFSNMHKNYSEYMVALPQRRSSKSISNMHKNYSEYMVDLPRRRSSKSISNSSRFSDQSDKVCEVQNATFEGKLNDLQSPEPAKINMPRNYSMPSARLANTANKSQIQPEMRWDVATRRFRRTDEFDESNADDAIEKECELNEFLGFQEGEELDAEKTKAVKKPNLSRLLSMPVTKLEAVAKRTRMSQEDDGSNEKPNSKLQFMLNARAKRRRTNAQDEFCEGWEHRMKNWEVEKLLPVKKEEKKLQFSRLNTREKKFEFSSLNSHSPVHVEETQMDCAADEKHEEVPSRSIKELTTPEIDRTMFLKLLSGEDVRTDKAQEAHTAPKKIANSMIENRTPIAATRSFRTLERMESTMESEKDTKSKFPPTRPVRSIDDYLADDVLSNNGDMLGSAENQSLISNIPHGFAEDDASLGLRSTSVSTVQQQPGVEFPCEGKPNSILVFPATTVAETMQSSIGGSQTSTEHSTTRLKTIVTPSQSQLESVTFDRTLRH